ncbi:MAG: hypothetical protein LLG24_09255 [Actinomycetia bacterium]|nr:hypothetical protein [Actinomycetes bacterium]
MRRVSSGSIPVAAFFAAWLRRPVVAFGSEAAAQLATAGVSPVPGPALSA